MLSMIGSEGVDLLVLLGDLGYEPDSAAVWEAQLDDALGRDFPVIAVVGNHEDLEWSTYRRLLAERLERAGGLRCDGRLGVKALCRFANLDIVQVAPGIRTVPGRCRPGTATRPTSRARSPTGPPIAGGCAPGT